MVHSSICIFDEVRAPIRMLLRAHDYAAQCGSDRWQFATRMSELVGAGAAVADVRWMIHQGFAEHAKEITVAGDPERSFRPLPPTCITAATCVVLTDLGATEIRAVVCSLERKNVAISRDRTPVHSEVAPIVVPAACPSKPCWDSELRELTYAGRLIKRYRVPAKSQMLILDAFQESAWPRSLDDPLPPEGDLDPKQRLASTIRSLNRNQHTKLIRFHGNGSGLQVYWDRVGSKKGE